MRVNLVDDGKPADYAVSAVLSQRLVDSSLLFPARRASISAMPAGPALGGTPMRVPATLIVSALVLLLGGCATDRTASQTGAAGFALIRDMPYYGRQTKEITTLMKDNTTPAPAY